MTLEQHPDVVLLHTILFEEVYESKKPVVSMCGYMVGGPDRKGINAPNRGKLFKIWQTDVQAAWRRSKAVPQRVIDYYQATKGYSSAPRVGEVVEIKHPGAPLEHPLLTNDHEGLFDASGVPQEETLNTLDLGLDLGLDSKPAIIPELSGGWSPTAGRFPLCEGKLENPPRFATSFTGMQEFVTCPRKFAASKYYKVVKYVESPEAADGNRGHLTAENYLKNSIRAGAELPVDPAYLPYVKRYCDFFLGMGADTLLVEQEMCCTKDLNKCGWRDWNTVWFRSKSDLLLIKDRKLLVGDWKFGKLKDDPFQIEVMIALANLHYGDQFDTADGKLIFVKEKDPKKAVVGLPKPVTKADIPAIWEKIFAITNRMEAAWESGVWRMQSSGLCKKHCEDFSCIHNGRR